jgi:membrane-bound lytic murein transglycosylase D
MLARVLSLVLTMLLAACGLRGATPVPDVHVHGASNDRATPSPQVGALPTPVVFAKLPCIDGPEVGTWERHFASHRRQWRSLIVGQRRGGRHLPTVRRMIQDAGLPPGLALLPAIESGFRADARGPHGSAGLWQLSATTARHHGLIVNETRDDRLDVERSTSVAISLLSDLHERYGTWPLALAAYNAGEGRLNQALRTQPGASFWDMAAEHRLPPTTRKYVPKFLGLVRFATGEWVCPPEGQPSSLASR